MDIFTNEVISLSKKEILGLMLPAGPIFSETPIEQNINSLAETIYNLDAGLITDKFGLAAAIPVPAQNLNQYPTTIVRLFFISEAMVMKRNS